MTQEQAEKLNKAMAHVKSFFLPKKEEKELDR